MGIRHLLNPPLPAGYYGNAFQSANAVLTGRDLNEWPLSKVAKMIKESKKVASDTNYIWNSINLLETLRHHKMKIETGSECLSSEGSDDDKLYGDNVVTSREEAQTNYGNSNELQRTTKAAHVVPIQRYEEHFKANPDIGECPENFVNPCYTK
ncbi:hypothetical protein RJ639_002174 [Escallonia herrerae]|uniref:Uncharacterized protein n=1 Tax=Escallonia herrerae TaxID=1293975 RepID=A0AA88X8J7_9ASTE|nr:hypothetical protein RJ639_002174 [Escallonia herrerae]